jgi:hypothetical protein
MRPLSGLDKFERVLRDQRGRRTLRPLGPEALARAIRERRWRAVHARCSRPGVSDRREPGSAEEKREPKGVHRLSVPATRELRQRSAPSFQTPYLCTRTNHPQLEDVQVRQFDVWDPTASLCRRARPAPDRHKPPSWVATTSTSAPLTIWPAGLRAQQALRKRLRHRRPPRVDPERGTTADQ